VNYKTDLHEPQVGRQQFDHLQVLTIQIVLFSVLKLLLAMAASLGYMSAGLVRAFSSPAVPSMQQISPHLVPDESAVSWISKYVIFTSNRFNSSRYEKEGVLIVCLNILVQLKLWVLKNPMLQVSFGLFNYAACSISLLSSFLSIGYQDLFLRL